MDQTSSHSTQETPLPSRRPLHRNVWVLAATSFLTDISSEMLANLLPLFLFSVLGVRTTAIGLIDGIAETTASLMKIYSGALSDRLRKRKWLTVAGYALSTLSKPFLYFASTWSAVLGVRFADRLGKGIRTAPRDALLAGSVTPEQRGLAFGLHRAGDTAGAFVGLAIAGGIIWASRSLSATIPGAESGTATLTRPIFQTVVLASILPALLAVIILALWGQDVESKSDDSRPQRLLSGWQAIDHRFRLFLVIMVLFTLGNSSDSFIILRAQERGLSLLEIIAMLLTFNAVYSSLSGPLGALSDRLGRRSLLLTGWFLYALVYLGLAIARTGVQVWGLFALYGVFYALTEGTAKAFVADLVPQSQRGSAYGFYNAAVGIAALPASVIAGFLWQGLGAWHGFGPSAPFVFGALMALMAALFFLIAMRTKPSSPAT